MARHVARDLHVERRDLLDFIRSRHNGILITHRRGNRLQVSPVTMGVHDDEILIATYPERAKAHNARHDPRVTVCVLSDDFGGEWVQVDGTAEVVHLPEAVEVLVDYYRCIRGEHADWDDYRQAMVNQGKCAIRVHIHTWGPISRGGFPSRLVDQE